MRVHIHTFAHAQSFLPLDLVSLVNERAGASPRCFSSVTVCSSQALCLHTHRIKSTNTSTGTMVPVGIFRILVFSEKFASFDVAFVSRLGDTCNQPTTHGPTTGGPNATPVWTRGFLASRKKRQPATATEGKALLGVHRPSLIGCKLQVQINRSA